MKKMKKRHAFTEGNVVYCGDVPCVIVESLSSGSFGDVYRATDVKNVKALAVKHLYGKYASDRKAFYNNTVKLANTPPPHRCLCFPTAVGKHISLPRRILCLPGAFFASPSQWGGGPKGRRGTP